MLVYHYTSLDAFTHIVDATGIHLWATLFSKLNDPREVALLRDVRLPKLARKYNKTKQEMMEIYENFPYILSLCENPDIPYMWEKYADNGNGVVLAFDKDTLKNIAAKNFEGNVEDDFFLQIRYCKPGEEDAAYDALSKIICCYNDEAMSDFQSFAFVKGEEYKVEQEWRYARIRQNIMSFEPIGEGNCKFHFDEDDRNIQHRQRSGEDIPYLTIDFPTNVLRQVHYLAKNFPHNEVNIIQDTLDKNPIGYKDVEVVPSNTIINI